MDIEKILTLPESKTLEFKRDLSSVDPILKTLVAFANTAGGMLVIGRDDIGNVLGVEHALKMEEKLSNLVSDSITPPLLPEIEIVTASAKTLLIVSVSRWRGPFYLNKLGEEAGTYIRLGSTNRRAGHEVIEEIKRSNLKKNT